MIAEIIHRGQWAGKMPVMAVTTYYDPFPDTYKRCQDILPIGGTFGLSVGEMAWLKLKLIKLNDNIRAVAKRHPQVKLVDLESVFKGHQWCSKDP